MNTITRVDGGARMHAGHGTGGREGGGFYTTRGMPGDFAARKGSCRS